MGRTVLDRMMFDLKCNKCKHQYYCRIQDVADELVLTLMDIDKERGSKIGHEIMDLIEEKCPFFELKKGGSS